MYMMDYFFGTEGGTERQVLELLLGLDRSRYRPVFVALQSSGYIERGDFPCDTRVLNIHGVLGPQAVLKMLKLALDILRSNIELVHVYFNDAAILAPFFCKLGGARVITSRRDMGFWYTPRVVSALRVSNLFVDRIAVNSNAVKSNVVNVEKYPERRIKVIYNGLNENRMESDKEPYFRETYKIGQGDLIVGTVSNLYDVKRPKDLIQAFKAVNERMKRVHLVLVGGGPKEIEPLKMYADKLNIKKEFIHFTGRIKNPIAIIKHFDVCVSCSESEGLSNAIIEYMACAKPIVCTNVGGNPEIIRNGYNGFLVDMGSILHLTERICAVLSDNQLGKTLGEHGRELYLSEFTSDIMIKKYIELYDNVVNGHITTQLLTSP